MHDDDAMTAEFRDLLKQALENGAKLLEQQREINAKLNQQLATLSEAMATYGADRRGVAGYGGRKDMSDRERIAKLEKALAEARQDRAHWHH